jgi:hypothetical protein
MLSRYALRRPLAADIPWDRLSASVGFERNQDKQWAAGRRAVECVVSDPFPAFQVREFADRSRYGRLVRWSQALFQTKTGITLAVLANTVSIELIDPSMGSSNQVEQSSSDE